MQEKQSYKNRKHTVAAVLFVILFSVLPFTVFAQDMDTVESEAPTDSDLDGFISESPSEAPSDNNTIHVILENKSTDNTDTDNSSSTDASLMGSDNTYENVYAGNDSSTSSSGEKIFHKPQLLLEDSNLFNQTVKAGTTQEMSVTFRNKSRSQNVYGLKISLSTETKGISFDRNSFYVQRLTPGEAITLKQNISIAKDMEPGQASVTFSLEYEDSRATGATGTEILTFLVSQPVRADLEVSDIPSVFYTMDTVEIPVKALNLSRDKIYNAKVQLKADGLNPNGTAFLGSAEAGTAAEGTIKVYVKGLSEDNNDTSSKNGAVSSSQMAGKFILTYEDSSGNSHETTTEFTFQIKDSQIQSLKIDTEQEETNSWWYSILAVLAFLMISTILILLVRLHKKTVLLEEVRKAASH